MVDALRRRLCQPWWLSGHAGAAHFVRGLVAMFLLGALAGWLLSTGDRLGWLWLRILVWFGIVVPAWGALKTGEVMWKCYRPTASSGQ